jgi:hypothetical protein
MGRVLRLCVRCSSLLRNPRSSVCIRGSCRSSVAGFGREEAQEAEGMKEELGRMSSWRFRLCRLGHDYFGRCKPLLTIFSEFKSHVSQPYSTR